MFLYVATSLESLDFFTHPGLRRTMQPSILPRSDKTAEDHSALLHRVGAKKDREAFVTLFNYFAPRVKSYLLKNGASEAAAEEVVQNTFVTIWEKAAGYDPKKAAASTWIFTIARNKRIDALRRERFIDVNTDSPELQNQAIQTIEEYAGPETVDQLNAAIDRLPEDQAKLIRMAFFEDKSHQAISDETHLPLGTVKSRLRLGMEKLKNALKGFAP
jgi:RNA polymerase sigma factor (sigma-70 family)